MTNGLRKAPCNQDVRLESATRLVGFSASPGPSLPCHNLCCLGIVSKNSGKKPLAKSSGSLPSNSVSFYTRCVALWKLQRLDRLDSMLHCSGRTAPLRLECSVQVASGLCSAANRALHHYVSCGLRTCAVRRACATRSCSLIYGLGSQIAWCGTHGCNAAWSRWRLSRVTWWKLGLSAGGQRRLGAKGSRTQLEAQSGNSVVTAW